MSVMSSFQSGLILQTLNLRRLRYFKTTHITYIINIVYVTLQTQTFQKLELQV